MMCRPSFPITYHLNARAPTPTPKRFCIPFPCLQNEVWEVINAFFEEKGLVSQQLDSFNHFMDFQIQEVVDDTAEITLKTNPQFDPSLENQPIVCTNDKFSK